MKKIGILMIILCFTMVAQAQNKKWTLQECIIQALENNISVKQSELDVELSKIDRLDAIGNYLPTLNAGASNSWNTGLTQNITTGVLQTQTSRNSSYSVSAGVTIFQGLVNLRAMQRSKLTQLSSEYGLSKMKDDVSLFVANAFLTVLTNKANLEVLTSQNAVTQTQINRTNDLVDAGVLPRGDLLEIRATDASERQSIALSENAVKISLISLAQLLKVDDYENFDIQDEGYDVIDEGISTKSVSELITAAKENRSEVKIASTNYELSKKELQIARAAYLPTLNGFFNYNTRESDNPSGFETIIDPDNPLIPTELPIGFVEGTETPVFGLNANVIGARELDALPFEEQLYLNDGISYGFQLNIPIFNGFSARNNVKRSKINMQRQEYILEQTKLDLESSIYQAFVDVKGSLKAYEAAQLALESQELAYQYAKDRYDVGLTNAFDFSQSKLRYDNTRIELNRAKYDYIFKLKVLELYFGVPVTDLKF